MMLATDETLLDVIDVLTMGQTITTEQPKVRRDDDGQPILNADGNPTPVRGVDGKPVMEKHPKWHDGLISQLRQAIASSVVGGAVAAGSKAGVPLDSDALEKYDNIDRTIGEWYVSAGLGVPGVLPEENLRALYAHVWQDAVDGIIDAVIRGWRVMIEEKLDPPKPFELIDLHTNVPESCPDCGMGWYEVVTNSGEKHPGNPQGGRWYEKERRVALVARYRTDGRGGLDRTVVECGCCGWQARGRYEIRALAYDLEARIAASESTVSGREDES